MQNIINNNIINNNSSDCIYERYTRFIKDTQLHLEPEKWYFKSNDNYTYMLEHVNSEHGKEYLKAIIENFKSFYENNLNFLIDLCNLNDKYGKTNKVEYKDFMKCSPTNLRYILHSLLILEYMKKSKLNELNIIEIGGGYGGLCFFINKIAEKFEIKINSYIIFDLQEASNLQKKYLDALSIENIKFYQLSNYSTLYENSFLISTYAFSEIPLEIQKEYTKKIINPFTNFGWIAWNNIPVYKFVENSIIDTEEELPKQSHHKYNCFVKYYPEI